MKVESVPSCVERQMRAHMYSNGTGDAVAEMQNAAARRIAKWMVRREGIAFVGKTVLIHYFWAFSTLICVFCTPAFRYREPNHQDSTRESPLAPRNPHVGGVVLWLPLATRLLEASCNVI